MVDLEKIDVVQVKYIMMKYLYDNMMAISHVEHTWRGGRGYFHIVIFLLLLLLLLL